MSTSTIVRIPRLFHLYRFTTYKEIPGIGLKIFPTLTLLKWFPGYGKFVLELQAF